MRLAGLVTCIVLLAALIFPRVTAAQNVDEVTALGNRVNKLYAEGKFAEAEVAAGKYVARAKARHGEKDIRYGAAISWLAYVYVAQGRLAEATPQFERAVAILEKALGANHPEVANALGNVAEMHRLQGRYADAEPVAKRSIAILEKQQGRDSPNLAAPVNTLAIVHFQQGHFAESEAAFKRSLAILEKSLGREHNNVAAVLIGLASVYLRQERYAEAEKLLQRSIAIREKVLGRDHADLAYSVDALGHLYQTQKRSAQAEPLLKRALAIREKALGPDHPDLAISLNNLAAMYAENDRLAEAEPLYVRAIAIERKSLGAEHSQLASTLNNLAELYRKQGKEQAEALHLEAIGIRLKSLDPDNPDTAQSYHNLAHVYFDRQDWSKATDYLRRGAQTMIRRSERGVAPDSGTTAAATSRKTEAAWSSQFFYVLIKAANRMPTAPAEKAALADEMFQAAQWAQSSDAAASLAQMATRGAARDPALAALVRERQDLLVEWVKYDAERIAAASRAIRDPKAEAATAQEIARIDARVAAIDKALADGFPDYAALARPKVLSLAQVQASLRDDEALVLTYDTRDWDPAPEETFVWVVTKTDSRWTRSELGTFGLAKHVAALRCGLDYQGSWSGPTSPCRGLLEIGYSQDDARAGKPLPFDAARAHLLYKELLGDAQDLIGGKQLLVVPSGPLTQLPFQVLITADPGSAAPGASDPRKLAWLARSNAITVLPAVSSLEALRRSGEASAGKRPFAGFGNPLLNGPDASYRDVKWQAMSNASCDALTRVLVAEARGLGVMPVALRGGIADVASLRQAIPLPETAEEVCDVARDIGADESDIFLGLRAAEGEIKRMNADGRLASYRMLHFATHGALAGQVSGSTEPGLLLTPPRQATQDDDGYLSASEIASLKLDADWVILSACNTAAGGADGAEALSGLARAFFYAGARALLVSHWYVDSRATVALIRGAFAELKADPRIGRAEALRRSMLALADNKDEQFAQPAAWAPFVVVGEGASE